MKWDRAQVASWLLVALCVIGFSWFILQNGAFLGDDILNFQAIKDRSVSGALMTPALGGHWSPFHRLSSWLVYNMAPMRFEVAVLFLMCFHVGTLVYLHATLRMLGLTVADKVIVCMYASCGLLVYGMIWFANAQLRVPHVLFCAAAIFHYLSWLKGGSNRHLWLAATAYLLDMFVYQKAVLIPVYLLVVGYLAAPARFREKPFRVSALPLALLVVSLIFTAVFEHFAPAEAFPATLRTVLRVDGHFLSALGRGLLGFVVENPQDTGSAYVLQQLWATLAVLLALVVATLRASPGVWKLWIGLFAVLALDYLPLATSNRYLFGGSMLNSNRYHFETVYLVAVFAGLFCARIRQDRERPREFSGKNVLAIAIVVVYLGINVASLAIARKTQWELRQELVCHDYMANLRAGLGSVTDPHPTFVDSKVPWQMGTLLGRFHAKDVVPLLIPGARFTSANEARYLVLESGEVIVQSPP